jgi:hypothetical protein
MPTSIRSPDEKEQCYTKPQDTYNKLKSKGPTYIAGDFNARLIYPCNSEEEQIMGGNTMFENKDAIEKLISGMLENRDLLTHFATANETKIINTLYQQKNTKLATYKIIKSTEREYEYITNKNTCTNRLHTHRKKMEKHNYRRRMSSYSKYRLRSLPTSFQNKN